MLKDRLIFPRLEFVRREQEGNLFRLDWEQFDAEVIKRHREEFSEEISFEGVLPERYEREVKEALFVEEATHFSEARAQARRASLEHGEVYTPPLLNTPYTSVCVLRDLRRDAVMAHTKAAFGLLTSYLYSPAIRKLAVKEHDPRVYYLTEAMLIRFWQFQSGHGGEVIGSGICELERKLAREDREEEIQCSAGCLEGANEFVQAVKAHLGESYIRDEERSHTGWWW